MNLTSLFSSDSLLKFQREKKPIEFQPKKQIDVNAIPIDESEKIALEDKQKQKLLKKAKRKDRKPKHEKVSDVIETNGEVADNSSNDIDSNVENQSSDIPVSQDDRTVFIGNLSVKETNKTIKELMSEFGEVDSIRLRSVPIAGTAVDEEGNQNLVRKVCVNNRKFGDQKGSFNAYVVLKDPKSVKLALDASNRVVNGRHIRIDTLKPTLFDTKLTLFLGGLPHYCDEEDLRNYFANVLPNGQDDIECVRIIRDPNTLIGKGIGYLLLKDTDAKLAALGLHEQKYKKRFPLRVMSCGKRTKRSNSNSFVVTENDVEDNEVDNVKGKPAKKPRWSDEKKESRKKLNIERLSNAARRIKNKALKGRR